MILKAAWVAPVATPPIPDGFVAWDAGRITACGSAVDLPASAEVQDLGPVVLTPGLVNAHAHLELTCYAGRLPRGPLWIWMAAMIEARRAGGESTAEQEAAGIVDGAQQSLRAGVTCIGDISRTNQAWPLLKPLPLRKVCFAELISIAKQPPRTIAELSAALDMVETDERLRVGISPHAPYTVTLEDLRAAIDFAATRHVPWTLHWAETREELAFLSGDASGLPKPVRQAQKQHAFKAPRIGATPYVEHVLGEHHGGLLAHANYTPIETMAMLARQGVTVAYCPRAHAYYGHKQHPYQTLRSAGVPVALATDSLASNESLSLLDECRYLWLSDERHPSSDELLEMITRIPAAALGLGHEIGTLEPGKQADLAAFALDAPEVAGNPLDPLMQQAPAAAAVWVAGERVSPS